MQKTYSFKSNVSYQKTVSSTFLVIVAIVIMILALVGKYVDWKQMNLLGKSFADIKLELEKAFSEIKPTTSPSINSASNLDVDNVAKNNFEVNITGLEGTPEIEKIQNGVKYKINTKNTKIHIETSTNFKKE